MITSDPSNNGAPSRSDDHEASTNPLDHLVSFYNSTRATSPSAAYSLRQFLAQIRDGAWQPHVLAVRSRYDDKEAYTATKNKLPCITACGTFTSHKASELQQHNRTVHGDVDNLTPEEMQVALDKLRNDPTVVYAFVGPS